jgi:hypothetical protein
VEVGVEGVRDAQERVDSGRSPSALEPRDRGLRRSDELGQVGLGKPAFLAPVGDLAGDLGEEPALLGSGEASANSLHGLTHISIMLYIAIVRYNRSIAIGSAVIHVASLIVFIAYWWHELDSDNSFYWPICALLAVQFLTGFAIGRWHALLLLPLLPLLSIPVPVPEDAYEPVPLWFVMLFYIGPLAAVLMLAGIGARKLWDRRRSPEVA